MDFLFSIVWETINAIVFIVLCVLIFHLEGVLSFWISFSVPWRRKLRISSLLPLAANLIYDPIGQLWLDMVFFLTFLLLDLLDLLGWFVISLRAECTLVVVTLLLKFDFLILKMFGLKPHLLIHTFIIIHYDCLHRYCRCYYISEPTHPHVPVFQGFRA